MYSSHAMPADMSGSTHDLVAGVMDSKSKPACSQLLLKTVSAASQLFRDARTLCLKGGAARIAGSDLIKQRAGKNVIPGRTGPL